MLFFTLLLLLLLFLLYSCLKPALKEIPEYMIMYYSQIVIKFFIKLLETVLGVLVFFHKKPTRGFTRCTSYLDLLGFDLLVHTDLMFGVF